MELKFAKLPENFTNSDIDLEIARLDKLKNVYKNKDSSYKVNLNSIYGYLGYDNAVIYNRDVAQSVTLESQYLINYTIEQFNSYFRNLWPNDTELHQHLGIVSPQNSPNFNAVNYADTDSIFLVIGPIFDDSGYVGEFHDFFLKLFEFRLDRWIHDRFTDYITKHRGILTRENNEKSLGIELEQICSSVLFVSKKKYIKSPIWNGKTLVKNSAITVKGLEINQSSTPKFVRNKLKDLVNYVFEVDGKIDVAHLLNTFRMVREEFTTTNIENICQINRVGEYNKYVINDKDEIVFGENAKPHVKGAGYFNYLLHNSNHRNQYSMIKSGNKVHFYYVKNTDYTYAFLNGQLVPEIAPEVDYMVQFEKVFLSPANNILKVLGVSTLSRTLVIKPSMSMDF